MDGFWRGGWLAAASAVVLACEGGGGPTWRFVLATPHDEYVAQLKQAGLDHTALGQDWIAVADSALAAPVDAPIPLEEARFLDPARAVAVVYRLTLEQGQRLTVRLAPAAGGPAPFRVFLDLFRVEDRATPPTDVASADSSAWALDYVALRAGTYLLRVQPELLRGGRVTLTLAARASLAFPVPGLDLTAVRSGWGAPRDAGRRDHQGVDIFAPRGTPVVAASAGWVAGRSTNRLGGNVVWLREAQYGRSLYYAHLDRRAVEAGQWVEPGDTIGFVGNTGNARTTPPHLHFGIYLRGYGAIDPYFHLLDPPDQPAGFTGDTALLGTWVAVARPAVLRAGPAGGSDALARLSPATPVRVLAGSGRWYLARLPDGRDGYLDARDAVPLTAVDSTVVAGVTALLAGPGPDAPPTATVPPGATLPVLGRFAGYVLVGLPDGVRGWLPEPRAVADD